MKKILIALAFVAALGFVVSPAYALYPVNDDVPGRDVFAPFFLVEKGTAGEDSLIIIQEVGKDGAPTYKNSLFYYIYDRSSLFRGDGALKISKKGVCSVSVRDMLNALQPAARQALEIDLDGDGTTDYYAGYIKILNYTAYTAATGALARISDNNLIATMYQIDLTNGFAGMVNIPVLEYAQGDAYASALYYTAAEDVRFAGDEILNANALQAAKSLQAGDLTPDLASWFKMFPRYYLKDANAKNYLIFWKSDKHTATGQSFSPHFNFWNTNEEALSGYLDLKYELNILNLTEPVSLLPSGLHTGYPKAGWIEVEFPDVDGSLFAGTRVWYGFNYQKAYAPSASLSWAGLAGIHFDAGTGTAY